MTKNDFIEKLKRRLSILDKNEIDDILEEYEGYIDEKVKSGSTEKEAIEEFGNFDDLVKDILSAYKIDEESLKDRNVITDFIDSCVDLFKRFFNSMKKKSGGDIFKIIIEFIVLLLFIAILKLPVILIEKLGEMLFGLVINPFGVVLSTVWKYMVELIYLVLAVMGIANFVKKECDFEDEPKKETLKRRNVKMNESKEEQKEIKEKVKTEGSMSATKIILIILKVCVAFILIPAIFSFVGAIVTMVIAIMTLCHGVPYVGIFLCILTFLIANYIFIELCIRFIANKKINSKLLISEIVATIIIFIAGIVLSIYEVTNTTFINNVDSIADKKTETRELIYTDTSDISCSTISHYGLCNYQTDDSLGDKVIITYTYYDYFKDRNITISDDLQYNITDGEKIYLKDGINLLFNDLKNREIHNYSSLYEVNVTITTSTDVKNKIDAKEEAKYDNYDESEDTEDTEY